MAATHFMMTDLIGQSHRNEISRIAWASIDSGLANGEPLTPSLSGYKELFVRPGASFVTLTTIQGRLRGCIGTLVSETPLLVNVSHNAHKAAFSDPRFTPLTAEERDILKLEVSVLSEHVRIEGETEQDILRQIMSHRDGVILREGERRATFLPAVWDSIPDVATFFRQLKLKGGFAEDYWSESIEVFRYTTETW